MVWMLLTLFYGMVKGAREIFKKKALEKSTVMEVLLGYTLIGFLFLLPDIPDAVNTDFSYMPFIFIKSFAIFVAWILSFTAIRELPVSLYGIIDLSRVIFAYFLGVIVLGEVLTTNQMIGLPLVIAGLLMLKFVKTKKTENSEKISPKCVVYTLVSCLLNAFSGLMDKLLMKDGHLTSKSLQFWYMLILLLLYIIYTLVRRIKIDIIRTLKNYWIYILSIIFILGDRALFIANSYPESRVTVMTLIKQSACFVTIILGWLVFREKNIGRKLLCASVVLAGIIIAVI